MTEYPPQESPTLEDYSEPQLPSTLNVLTILTIIGSVVQIITGFTSYWTACSNIDKIEKASSQDGLPEWMQNIMGSAVEITQKQCDNRMTIMIVTLLAGILCLIGAIQMRRRVKQGFIFYCVGEFMPAIVNVFIIGMGTTVGLVSSVFAILWAGLWVLLYGLQSRHFTR